MASLRQDLRGCLQAHEYTPLAAAVMTVEIFGPQYSLPAGFSSVVAFQIAGRRTICDYALELSEKGHYGDWK